MAIRNRRGVYSDFDKTKMVDGEFAVVKSGDPDGSGKAVYISFESGTADRLALFEDLEEYVEEYGGKIDVIAANNEDLPVVDKRVDITIPTKTSDLTNDGDGTSKYATEDDTRIVISAPAGDIVEFSTGGDNMPMKAVEVSMSPIQDLNGYDAPWPAGGNKNLIPYPYSADAQTIISSGTWNGMTIAENNGKIRVKGTQNYTSLCIFAFFKLKANTTYTFSTNYQYANDSTTMYCTIYDPTKAKLYANPKTATPVTFTTTEECTVRIYLNPATSDNGRSFDFTIQPQLEEGSSASEWTPYSNICPISGRTGASVVVSGENLIGEMENGYIASDGHEISPSSSKHEMVSGFIPVEEGVDYIYEYVPVNVTSTTWTGYCFYSAADMSARVGSRVVTDEADAITITPPSGAKYIRIGSRFLQNGGTAEFRVKTTYPIIFTSAGTVYAGTVDLVSGELTVTGVYLQLGADVAMNGTAVASGVRRFYTVENVPYTKVLMCDSLQASETYVYNKLNYISTTPTNTRIAVTPSWAQSMTTLAEFNAALADNPINFVAELVTPLIYNLTPVQVMSLLGENVVWSPDGTISNLKYSADISLVVADLYSKLSS